MVLVFMVGIEVFGWCKTEILRNLVFSGFLIWMWFCGF